MSGDSPEFTMRATDDRAREYHALSLVIGSAVVKVGEAGGYTKAGMAVPADLAQTFDRFLSQGLTTLAYASAGGLRRVCLTRAGRALHTALFCGDLATISAAHRTPDPAELVDDPAYQCDDHLPGHRHVLDSTPSRPYGRPWP